MLKHPFWQIISVVILVCACTSETDLPFEPGGVFDKAPEELRGNWKAAYSSEELVISENSIIWQGKEYEIFSGHPLVKVTRIVAASGSDTLALYADEIADRTFSGAIYSGTDLPLDETGELPHDNVKQYSRWWYPLGVKYPAIGTQWVYSLYSFRERGHGDDYRSRSKYVGSVSIEVVESNPGDQNYPLKLRKTFELDTLETYHWEAVWSVQSVNVASTTLATVITDTTYSIDYWIYYSNDSLFIAQDSTDLVISPMQVTDNSRIYMQLFSVNNESYLVGRDITLENGRGISSINFRDYWSGITWWNFDFKLELLEYHPG